jgi:hypothetical protein
VCSCLLVFHSDATCVNLQKRLEFENACIGSLDPDVCASVFDGVMTKGLGSAVQTLVSLFNDVIGGAQANSVQSIAVRQDLFKDVSGVWLHTEHNTPSAPHGTHLPEHLPPLLTLSPSSIAPTVPTCYPCFRYSSFLVMVRSVTRLVHVASLLCAHDAIAEGLAGRSGAVKTRATRDGADRNIPCRHPRHVQRRL